MSLKLGPLVLGPTAGIYLVLFGVYNIYVRSVEPQLKKHKFSWRDVYRWWSLKVLFGPDTYRGSRIDGGIFFSHP